MSCLKMLSLVAIVLTTLQLSSAQDCVRANSDGADSLPSFLDPGGNAPRIEVNPIQAIIKSYEFHCCGRVGGWAAYVEPGGGVHTTAYSIKFQIWRPMGNNMFVKIGENSFPLLILAVDSRIEETLINSEQLDFLPGDVVGYYLEQDGGDNGGLQFDSSFNVEELLYATGNSDLQTECLLEVGNAGDLSISASLGPIISISLTTTINDNCPSTFTSTMFCPTPTPISTVPGTPVVVDDCLMATDGTRPLPNFVRPGGGGEPRFEVTPVQVIIPSYQFDCYGQITEWRAYVEGSGNGHFGDQPYSITFQVWRPSSPPDGQYTIVGLNDFSPISLADPGTADRGIVTGIPLENERIEVQPGDVVGFYLESSRSTGDGIQFAKPSDNASPYAAETVWFGSTRCSTLDPPCVYSVDDFNSMTNLAPLITVTVVSTPTIPSSTLLPQVPSSTNVNAQTSSFAPLPSTTPPVAMPPVSTPPVAPNSTPTVSKLPVSTPSGVASSSIDCDGPLDMQSTSVPTTTPPTSAPSSPSPPVQPAVLPLYAIGAGSGVCALLLLVILLLAVCLCVRRSHRRSSHRKEVIELNSLRQPTDNMSRNPSYMSNTHASINYEGEMYSYIDPEDILARNPIVEIETDQVATSSNIAYSIARRSGDSSEMATSAPLTREEMHSNQVPTADNICYESAIPRGNGVNS